jgi:flagellar M-ring protein FliF
MQLLILINKKLPSKHSDGAIESRQQTSEKVTNGTATGGVPGTQTNIPTYPTDTQTNQGTISEKYSSTENFQPNVVQQETVVSPGQIKRLTISVMADTDSITAQQLNSIEGIVASAAGVNQTRGDVIQVAGIPFDKTTMLQEQAAMDIASRNAKILQYAEIGGAIWQYWCLLLFCFSEPGRGEKCWERANACNV